MFKFTKTLPKCKSVTPWCLFVQLVVEWARATAVAWEQSQFYCFYCCSPPLRHQHHHRQHHCQHHRQLLFKLSLSLSSFFSLSSSSWPGKNPGFIAFIVVSNPTQASLQPLYSHTPKLPANYISNTIRIISKLNKEERTRIDCIVIILLTLISMHKVLNDFPL